MHTNDIYICRFKNASFNGALYYSGGCIDIFHNQIFIPVAFPEYADNTTFMGWMNIMCACPNLPTDSPHRCQNNINMAPEGANRERRYIFHGVLVSCGPDGNTRELIVVVTERSRRSMVIMRRPWAPTISCRGDTWFAAAWSISGDTCL